MTTTLQCSSKTRGWLVSSHTRPASLAIFRGAYRAQCPHSFSPAPRKVFNWIVFPARDAC